MIFVNAQHDRSVRVVPCEANNNPNDIVESVAHTAVPDKLLGVSSLTGQSDVCCVRSERVIITCIGKKSKAFRPHVRASNRYTFAFYKTN